jgi:hypothetical protein
MSDGQDPRYARLRSSQRAATRECGVSQPGFPSPYADRNRDVAISYLRHTAKEGATSSHDCHGHS